MAQRLFALDNNFPEPIVTVLQDYLVEAELVPVRLIDERLQTVDDWELLLALHHHERPWDGLVTTDSSMLEQAREMSVLCQTKLTLVAAMAAGHDPVMATGLLFTHLPNVCERTRPDVAQLWPLRPANRPHTDPWERLTAIGARDDREATDIYDENKLDGTGLARDPLAE